MPDTRAATLPRLGGYIQHLHVAANAAAQSHDVRRKKPNRTQVGEGRRPKPSSTKEDKRVDESRVGHDLVLHAPEAIFEMERQEDYTPDAKPQRECPEHHVKHPGG